MRSYTSISNSPVINSQSPFSSNPEISTSPSHRDDHVTGLSPETPNRRSSQDTATLEIKKLSDTEIYGTSDNEN